MAAAAAAAAVVVGGGDAAEDAWIVVVVVVVGLPAAATEAVGEGATGAAEAGRGVVAGAGAAVEVVEAGVGRADPLLVSGEDVTAVAAVAWRSGKLGRPTGGGDVPILGPGNGGWAWLGTNPGGAAVSAFLPSSSHSGYPSCDIRIRFASRGGGAGNERRSAAPRTCPSIGNV